jgi:hypothetical protein
MRFEPDIAVEQPLCQPLQQYARNQPIEIAFMGDDHFRSWQGHSHLVAT